MNIDKAENYLLDISLDCQSSETLKMPGLEEVMIYVSRFNSNNEPILTNTTDFSKAILGSITGYCRTSDPQFREQRLLEFDAPAIPGTEDRITVAIGVRIGAEGNRDSNNINPDDSAVMVGTIAVKKQQ
ncbi:TPA: hypothetical protein EYP38_04235 [Candidatus Micrarchaeota archaeon]|nr:hypothetical protein [Candidatus Micrarchaeota archaeon]